MDNLGVRITADASGVAPGVGQTKTELSALEGFVATLNASFQSLGAQMRAAFTTGAESTAAMSGAIKTTEAATISETAALTAMVAKIHEGAESVRTFQMRAKEFAEVYVAMFAVDQIAHFIAKMGEASEKIQHLSQQFGMTTGEVQKLQGVATATGIPVDALTRGMGLLDRNLATAASGSKRMQQAFDAVGISLDDGRDQMQKLMVVADKFKDMDDGPKKVALAMQLFGRSGKELIPVLNLGSQGIEDLNKKMEEYGVQNDDAVAKGTVLAENVNETKLGFMGVENVLTSALAPAFTFLVQGLNSMIAAFIKSYTQGGLVRQIFSVIATVIEIVVQVVESLGEIFSAVWSAVSSIVQEMGSLFGEVFGKSIPSHVGAAQQVINMFRSLIVLTKDGILDFVDIVSGAFTELEQTVATFGKIAWDALTLHWGSIESDWKAGLGSIESMVEATAAKIRGRAAEMGAAFHGTLKFDDKPEGGLKEPKGSGDFDFSPSPTGKKEREKKPKDDLVQQLQEELEAKKSAWNEEQLSQDTAQEYSLQSEADYWRRALDRTDLSAKDKAAIERKWIAASQAVQKEDIQRRLDGYKEDLAAAGNNWQMKLGILRDEQAYLAHKYGEDSQQARQAATAVVDAERQAAAQIRQLQDDLFKHQQELRLLGVDEEEAEADFRVKMGLTTDGEILQQDRQFENQRYQIRLQSLNMQRMIIDPLRDPEKYRQVSQQIELLEAQHQARLSDIDRRAVVERTQIERNFISSMASGWGNLIGQMLTLQKGLGASVKAVWQTLQQSIGAAISSIIQNWLTQQLSALLVSKAAHLVTAKTYIAGEAAKAGAGGVASMAAAPFPMDLTAPAFGAQMAALATAFGAIPAAEGGWWDVQPGLAQLHAREMVLPAWAASPLRDMLSGRAQTGSPAPPGGDASGETHLHLHGGMIMGPREIRKFFEDNRNAVGAGVRSFVRNGGSTAIGGRR